MSATRATSGECVVAHGVDRGEKLLLRAVLGEEHLERPLGLEAHTRPRFRHPLREDPATLRADAVPGAPVLWSTAALARPAATSRLGSSYTLLSARGQMWWIMLRFRCRTSS